MPSADSTLQIGSSHRLRIIIDQTSQSQAGNHSNVRVRGIMYNDSGYRDWNAYNNIHRAISGEEYWDPGNFGFDLSGGESLTFLDHTFTIGHNADGTKTVSFTVTYGDTQIAGFDGPKSKSDTLTLTRIGSHPDAPGQPQFSNITPTTVTVDWTAPGDDNGLSITNYKLRRWTGPSQSGTYTDSNSNSRTRNVTGLIPGGVYTFAAYAYNAAGWSAASTDNHLTLFAGGMIRVGGVWKSATPYVRVDGVWKVAIPYIRSGGTWHQAV
jgi:Fibronectin type III domain/Siphovirus protein of unknown function (DUF859)